MLLPIPQKQQFFGHIFQHIFSQIMSSGKCITNVCNNLYDQICYKWSQNVAVLFISYIKFNYNLLLKVNNRSIILLQSRFSSNKNSLEMSPTLQLAEAAKTFRVNLYLLSLIISRIRTAYVIYQTKPKEAYQQKFY